ncbi:energy transducer TonB [Hyalangium sp.]|uniref:energy transducer TonB n=1 Tax=Hyalangium sp. TaxID=2028555 RepID=UPI002D3A351E|nr:energy transducer TonB [Hyalangium sp.]HYI00272.1 energy transducer TonB [Hyalangium sp.]
MFQSVIEQQEWRMRRLGTGAGVSLMVHAGLFAAVMVLTAGVAEQVEKEPVVVVFKRPPPRGTPVPPVTQKAMAEQPKPERRKPKDLKAPTKAPTMPPPEVAQNPEPTEPPDETLPFDPDGRPDGVGDQGPCMTCPIGEPPTGEVVEPPPSEEVLPFVSGNMTSPKLLSGAPIQYTREALKSGVTGLLIARCIITREGEVENCRVLKGQPHMSEAVVSALETRRYDPVQYAGRPISVIYNFHIKLNMPH